MTPQIATILGLVIMFIVATALPINMGAVAFALAFIIGGVWVGLEGKEVLAGFPGDLFLTLVGITYLFAIAQKNGTIDLLVHWAVRAVRGRIVAIPWVMFVITGLLTAFGALGPAAVAIIGPVALRFAKQYRINPLMMGLLVIHGAQGGGFSPISVYGGITNKVVEKAGLDVSEMAVFLTSLGFNLMMAIICFCDAQRNAPATGARERGRHLAHAVAAPGAQIDHQALALALQVIDGIHMRARQIHHMQIVAHAGAVVGGIVVAEDLQCRATPHCHLCDVGHQVVRYASRIFAQIPAGVRTHRVEVAQQRRVEIRPRGAEVADHFFHHQLGAPVGVDRLQRRAFVDRAAVGVAIHGGRRAEHQVAHLGSPHRA